MPKRMTRLRRLAPLAAVLPLISCQLIQPSTPSSSVQTTSSPSATRTQPPALDPAQASQESPQAAEVNCDEPATQIQIGEPLDSEIIGRDQPPGNREYFCVLIPDGVTLITFDLTSMTTDLNLYVGYPDIETVQNGGFSFWYSETPDTADENLTVGPGIADYVQPGTYYIEVSAEDFRATSPFTLLVSVP